MVTKEIKSLKAFSEGIFEKKNIKTSTFTLTGVFLGNLLLRNY
jgi:hypothetical protein